MTGAETVEGRYWPTASSYALALTCVDCGSLAWSCHCALADNAATGQGQEIEWLPDGAA